MDDHFYVEVYEKDGKYLKTTEKVICINPPGIVPSELSVTTFSDRSGEARLEWKRGHRRDVPPRHRAGHDQPPCGLWRSPAPTARVAAPVTVANITGLSEDVEYRFAVAAERRDVSGSVTYSMPSYIDQIMNWE